MLAEVRHVPRAGRKGMARATHGVGSKLSAAEIESDRQSANEQKHNATRKPPMGAYPNLPRKISTPSCSHGVEEK